MDVVDMRRRKECISVAVYVEHTGDEAASLLKQGKIVYASLLECDPSI